MAQDAQGLSGLRHEHHPLRQLVRFGLVGVCTLVVDFTVYRSTMYAGLPLSVAKALGFIVGTTCAYLLNRAWTFKAAGGRGPVARFLLVYALTLVVNVGVNALCVHLLQGRSFRIEGAFLIAQAVSSALNFVGLRSFRSLRSIRPLARSRPPGTGVSRRGRGTRS